MKLRVFSFLIAVLLVGIRGYAQDSRAVITGSLKDASGAVIVGAVVTAENTATNVKISTITNKDGVYEIPYLLPGTYNITADAPGFKTFVRENFELRISDRAELDVNLEPGRITETIVVTTQAPLLEFQSASIGTTVDSKSLVDLPISGGNADTMAQLAPGVTNFSISNHPNTANSLNSAADIAVGGMRSYNTEFTVDGTPAMGNQGGNDQAAYVPPVDMIQQTKIQLNSYDASYGHSVGGYIDHVTRSGQNRIHGSLYEFHTDDSLLGLNYFQRAHLYNPNAGPVLGPPSKAKLDAIKGPEVVNRYGGSVGGPVAIPGVYDGHDKTFWFFAYEGYQAITNEVNAGAQFTVPTLAERQGDFSALLALGSGYQIYDPNTTTCVGTSCTRKPFMCNGTPCNIIPQSRIDPNALAYLKYYPLPNDPADTLSTGQDNYYRPIVSGPGGFNSYTLRVDQVFSQRERIFGRVNFLTNTGYTSGAFANPATISTNTGAATGAALDNVYVFSPTFIVDTRYGFSRFIQPVQVPRTDLTSLGLSPGLIAQIPPQGIAFPGIEIDSAAYTRLGSTNPSSGIITNYHVASTDFTKSSGRQTLRFGGDFRVYLANNTTLTNATPSMLFNSTYTSASSNAAVIPIGQGLASFLLGLPTSGTMVVNASYAIASKYGSSYIQDDFRVTSRLTVNAGVRYEYETAPTERHNRMVAGFDATALNPIGATAIPIYNTDPISQVPAGQFAVNGGLTFAGVNGNSRGIWSPDRHNVAPRFGAAFRLNSKTSVRGGYGIFYMPKGVDRTGTVPDRWAVNQSGFSATTQLVPSLNQGLTYVASLENPFPNGLVQPQGAAGGFSTFLGQPITFNNPHQVNPLVQRWTFGFQRQLPKQILLELNYAGTSGRDLATTRQIDAIPRQYLSTLPTRDTTKINALAALATNPFYGLISGAAASLAEATTTVAQLVLPYPEFTSITYNETNGTSIYNAAYIRGEKRFSSGWSFIGNYTWSKFMQSTEYLNATDADPTHVISDLDIPEKFGLSGIYDIPIGRGRKFGSHWNSVVNGFAGGWQLSMIWVAQSGTPLGFGNAIYRGDPHNITLPNSKKTVTEWFNIGNTNYADNCPGATVGFDKCPADQLLYNIQTLPLRFPEVRTQGQNNTNASIMKYFPLREGMRLQLRVESMNAWNHSQFTAPNTSPTSSLFGQITAVQSIARQINIAAKIMF